MLLAMSFALTSSLVAPPLHLSRAALLRTAASAALALPLGAKAVEAPPPFEVGTKDAFAAFAAGEYTRAEQLWSRAAETYPDSALAFANLATLLIINASDKMTLGVAAASQPKSAPLLPSPPITHLHWPRRAADGRGTATARAGPRGHRSGGGARGECTAARPSLSNPTLTPTPTTNQVRLPAPAPARFPVWPAKPHHLWTLGTIDLGPAAA